MVRTYKRKKSGPDEAALRSAVAEVLEGKLSLRKAAEKHHVKPGTVQRRVEKAKQTGERNNCVFTPEQEDQLEDYIIETGKTHYGVTLTQLRQLAYQLAKKLGCDYPSTWDDNECAGKEWELAFRKRHPSISFRKHGNISVARLYGFNKHAVSVFFDVLSNSLLENKFTPDRIFNFGEIGIPTVFDTKVSAEQGELVTFGGIVNAIGDTFPPVFVYPRVRFKDHFLTDAPAGSLGLAARGGRMNSSLFLKVLKHIQKCANCTTEKMIMLLCDNSESHVSIEAVDYCHANGIVFVSFPPNTSHRLEPLHVGAFGPFMAELKVAINDWLTNHPGEVLSIDDIAGRAKLAYLQSFTTSRIASAFAKPGIWPLNRSAFTEDDFVPCNVHNNRNPTSSRPPKNQPEWVITDGDIPVLPEGCLIRISEQRQYVYGAETERAC